MGRGWNALALGLRTRMGSVHLDESALLTWSYVQLWVAGAGTLWHPRAPLEATFLKGVVWLRPWRGFSCHVLWGRPSVELGGSLAQ